MSKGRKATPPELKDNNSYKDIGAIKRQKAQMPQINSAKLVPPKWLSKGAKAEWKRVVNLYKELEIAVLNDLDKATLASYAMEVDIRDELYREWVKEEKCLIEDMTYRTHVETSPSDQPLKKSGGSTKRKIVNPILREIERHSSTIRILAEQLALTPAGRAACAVRQEKANRSPAEEFMGDD